MNTKRDFGFLVFIGGVLIAAWAYAQGGIHADYLAYNTPRTHYYSVGDGDFVSGNLTFSWTGSGNGGTYPHNPGTGWLVAAVHLPEGAVITEFKAYVYDNASGDLSISFYRQMLGAGGFNVVAEVNSSDTPGYKEYTDTSISNAVVDNQAYSYLVNVYSSDWTGTNSLLIKGAVVEYTISEAD